MKKSFDHIARLYQPLEYLLLGRTLERARFSHLQCLRNARRVLVLGEGDGRLLSRLLSLAPRCQVDVVERSARMLARARTRVDSSRVNWLHTDAMQTDWTTHISKPPDVIITAFFLDCFSEAKLTELMDRLYRQLCPGGMWLNVDFAIPSSGWRRWHARMWLSVLYRAFGALTDIDARELVETGRQFRSLGMTREHYRSLHAELVFSEIWRKPGTPCLLSP